MTLMWSPPPDRSACATSSMCSPVPTSTARPLVARRAQQHARSSARRRSGTSTRRRPRRRASRRRCSSWRSPAADDPVERHHDRDLEERGDDARQPRAHGAVAVEAGLGEQQRGDEEGEGHVVLGLVEGDRRVQASRAAALSPSAVTMARKIAAKSSASSDTARATRRSVSMRSRNESAGGRLRRTSRSGQRRRRRRRRRGPRSVLGRSARRHLPAPNGQGMDVARLVTIERPTAERRRACRLRPGRSCAADRRAATPWAPSPSSVARARDVGLAHLRIVDRQRLVDDLRARAGHLDDRLGQLRAA